MDAAPTPPRSSPIYPKRWGGTAIILGPAKCLPEDYARAAALRPQHTLIAMKWAAGWKAAPMVFCGSHGARNREWRAAQRRLGDHHVELHAKPSMRRDPTLHDGVDYWWYDLPSAGATCTATLGFAKVIGFDEVILCGAPMSGGGGYVVDVPNFVGGGVGRWDAKHPLLLTWQEGFRKYRKRGEFASCYSMSGWTREQLGGPPA